MTLAFCPSYRCQIRPRCEGCAPPLSRECRGWQQAFRVLGRARLTAGQADPSARESWSGPQPAWLDCLFPISPVQCVSSRLGLVLDSIVVVARRFGHHGLLPWPKEMRVLSRTRLHSSATDQATRTYAL